MLPNLKKYLFIGLLLASLGKASGQSGQSVLWLGATPGLGMGVYNGIGIGLGADVRYQRPLTRKLVAIARSGLDLFVIKGRYSEQFRKEYNTTVGLSIPITVGPRYYFLESLYGGLQLGADISITRLGVSSFRFEPSVGKVFPIAGGRYLDVGASIPTSMSRGSGMFLFNVAYGLGL